MKSSNVYIQMLMLCGGCRMTLYKTEDNLYISKIFTNNLVVAIRYHLTFAYVDSYQFS